MESSANTALAPSFRPNSRILPHTVNRCHQHQQGVAPILLVTQPRVDYCTVVLPRDPFFPALAEMGISSTYFLIISLNHRPLSDCVQCGSEIAALPALLMATTPTLPPLRPEQPSTSFEPCVNRSRHSQANSSMTVEASFTKLSGLTPVMKLWF